MRMYAVLLLLSLLPSDHGFPVRVERQDGKVVHLRPYTAPDLVMKLQSGSLENKTVLNCKQIVTHKDFSDHGDTEVLFVCGDAIMELKGVYFGE